MAIWDDNEDSEWEKYQKSVQKQKQPENVQECTPQEESKSDQKEASLFQMLKESFRKKREKPEVPPEMCPWCGKQMYQGYLWGPEHGIEWLNEKSLFPSGDLISDEGFSCNFKIAFYCKNCQKITLNVQETSIHI